MGMSQYKRLYKHEAITVPISEIWLTEVVHIARNPHYTCVGKIYQKGIDYYV